MLYVLQARVSMHVCLQFAKRWMLSAKKMITGSILRDSLSHLYVYISCSMVGWLCIYLRHVDNDLAK